MKLANVKAHCLVPYVRPTKETVDDIARSIRQDPDFRNKYHAFTCLQWHPELKRLFCGTTSFANDLIQSFDPATGQFESMRYQDFGEMYEIKIHRALDLGNDGMLYGATSSLHDVDERDQAPGGKIFRFDPKTRQYELLCIPKPHDYIQTTTLDSQRGMIYGFNYPVFNFFAYSLAKGKVVFQQYMGSITHISAVDDDGGYWGTWGHAHKLFRYDPATNELTYHKTELTSGCDSLMYKGAGPIDGMINGHDGLLYIGGEKGELYSLDPKTAQVEYLGRPVPTNRLPGLCLGPDGMLYGVTGTDDNVVIFAYDRAARSFDVLGQVRDASGEACFRPHDLRMVNDRLFVGETDNPKRTCYLWECELA